MAARERFERSGSAKRHFSVEVMRGGHVAFRYFNPIDNWARTPRSWRRSLAGLGISIMPTPGPRVLGYLSSDYLAKFMGTAKTWRPTGVERSVDISLSRLAMLLLIYPFIRFVRGPLRRARRRADGCCRWCGYNLTGNESGACSECGKDTTCPA